jgi:hypothetical protein
MAHRNVPWRVIMHVTGDDSGGNERAYLTSARTVAYTGITDLGAQDALPIYGRR